MSLRNVLSTMTGAPARLPTGAPAPAMPGPVNPAAMALPADAAAPDSGGGMMGDLKQALPMIFAALAGAKGGAGGSGAFLQGVVQGMERRQREAGEASDRTYARDQDALQRTDALDAREQARKDRVAQLLLDATTQASQFDDPVQFEQFVTTMDDVLARTHGEAPGSFRARVSFSDSKARTKMQREAAARLEELRKAGYDLSDEGTVNGATVTFRDRELRIADLMVLAGAPTKTVAAPTSVPLGIRGGATTVGLPKRQPVLPPAKEEAGGSPFAQFLRNEFALEEERLKRPLNAADRRRVSLRAQREFNTRGAGSSGSRAATRNPRGANAIPQGVEAYIISMRNRGYPQSEAMSEMFSQGVWAKMRRDHPTMTAERAREAIARLIPEEGAPVSAPSADGRDREAGTASGPAAPDDRVMSVAELEAAADRLGMDVAEARREYEARGFVIR